MQANIRINKKSRLEEAIVLVGSTSAGLGYEAYLFFLGGGDAVVDVPSCLAYGLECCYFYSVRLLHDEAPHRRSYITLYEICACLGHAKSFLSVLDYANGLCIFGEDDDDGMRLDDDDDDDDPDDDDMDDDGQSNNTETTRDPGDDSGVATDSQAASDTA